MKDRKLSTKKVYQLISIFNNFPEPKDNEEHTEVDLGYFYGNLKSIPRMVTLKPEDEK